MIKKPVRKYVLVVDGGIAAISSIKKPGYLELTGQDAVDCVHPYAKIVGGKLIVPDSQEVAAMKSAKAAGREAAILAEWEASDKNPLQELKTAEALYRLAGLTEKDWIIASIQERLAGDVTAIEVLAQKRQEVRNKMGL